MNYLNKLQEKCNLSDEFINIIFQIFEKLVQFGYVPKRQIKKLQKKLYNNIDIVLFGNEITLDYKTGYYDAVKKELYIKDIRNLEAIFLRIIYILTTNEVSRDSYAVGYSCTSLSKSNYKIQHSNFGINRAVVSNLVCRLLYTIPTTLTIMPTYRTYNSDFLGNDISSDNDIYFLEGKLLRQICYALDISEENLYQNIFNTPQKYLSRFFAKAKFFNFKELLETLDNASRKYSNYNKLIFLNKLLNENYLSIKKNILNENIQDLKKEQKKILLAIQNALQPFVKTDDNDENANIESSLSEVIEQLEEIVINDISKIQNMLVDKLIENELKYSPIAYAIKLKELDNMLIVKNQKLLNALYDIVSSKLLNTSDDTAPNLIDKIKYSVIQEILSSDKYIKIYKNMTLKNLEEIETSKNSAIVALAIDNSFIQLLKVENLDNHMKDLESNVTTFHLDNLGYNLNNPTTTQDINKIEKLVTAIKKKYTAFSQTKIECMYTCVIDTQNIL